MIKAVLVFNNQGKTRFMKFYLGELTVEKQQQIVHETYLLVSKRADTNCNFLDGGKHIGGPHWKLIYRHYATLYFVFCVDSNESELAILDIIEVFVGVLNKCFENVCELDLIFNVDKVHYVLNEIVMGGVVLATNSCEILERVVEQMRIEKKELGMMVNTKSVTDLMNTHLSVVKLPHLGITQALKELTH